jgi:hypothetical protein
MAEEVVILLAVRDEKGLMLYVPRTLRQLISDPDWNYIDELLKDLNRRAAFSPDAVFEQISNLSVGPIVTDTVRRTELPESEIGGLYPGFFPLSINRL